MARMTYKEAMQNLARIESDHFIESLYKFDRSCLGIPYAEILEDWRLGEHKQKYKNWLNTGEHVFLYRMQLGIDLDLVANTLQRIADHNQWSWCAKHFTNLLDRMPSEFVSDLFTKKSLR